MVMGPTRSEAVRLRWWVLIGLLVAGLGGFGLWMVVTRFWPDPAMELALLGLLGVTCWGYWASPSPG